jgi:hypothetical protein
MDDHHEIENRRRTAMKRIIIMALGVLMALALATPMALAQVGQGAIKSGTAEELAVAWTQWAFSKPTNEDSPLVGGDPNRPYSEARCDGTPLSPTQGKTWFLAGTFDNTVVERHCTMPVGTHLFFPVVNWIAFPFPGANPPETAEGERQKAIAAMDATLNDPNRIIQVTVDGQEVKSNRIVRAISPRFFTVTLPEENAFDPFVNPNPPGVRAGVYEGWTTDGLWVTLPPLPPGVHEIHFAASALNGGVSQDNTYILTVVNKGKPAP